MNKKLQYQTLHCHTISSDGLLTHQQVLEECFKNNISVVAYTDHDVLPDTDEIERLKKLNHQVKFISGIEISCDYIPEAGEMSGLHVTGLFVDLGNKQLREFSEKQLEGRVIRMKMFVKKLTDLGFIITEEDVWKNVPGKSIVQPHIVAALKSHPENLLLLDSFLQELKIVAKTDQLRKKQLEEILAREENQKWYVLVMSGNSLHSAYVKYQNESKISVDDAVKLIREAGGVAQVAHWSYNRDKFTLDIIEKYLKENRLDGMETVYAFGNESNPDLFLSDMNDLANLCDQYAKIQGGGGDFHKQEDFALMSNRKFLYLAERTKGLLERIREKHPDLDLTWTSLEK